jgi:hypothetical protein
VNGDLFATIDATGAGEPVITGADGQPLSDEDALAMQTIFLISAVGLASFDIMIIPVGVFLTPEA